VNDEGQGVDARAGLTVPLGIGGASCECNAGLTCGVAGKVASVNLAGGLRAV